MAGSSLTFKYETRVEVTDIDKSTNLEWSIMEQHTFKNVNSCLNTNIYSYLETSGGPSYNPYLNVVQFLNTRVD